ncbi:UNVERIFIED_CONTAM: hypothetical protein HDU68_005489 [Siphonaria sp. JEL0065]|nr:hypothetical protein HDU68_005489 [Siphonaria sp. JEL0065]
MPKNSKKRNSESSSSSSSKKTKVDVEVGPGSLDVAIPSNASVDEVLAFALEELAKDTDESMAIAQKLLEEGLARLETTDPNLLSDGWHAVHVSSHSNVVLYAKVALALASALNLKELFDRIEKGLDSITEKDADLWLLTGEVAIKKLLAKKRLDLKNTLYASQDDDEGDDEEENEEEVLDDDQKPEIDLEARAEVETMQNARSAFLSAVDALKKEANEQTLLKVNIAQLLRNYALAVRQSDRKSPVPISVLTFALSIADIPFDPSAPLIPEQTSQDLLHSTKASCLYYLARFRAAGSGGKSGTGDERGATQDIKECIRSLSLVVGKESNESNQELLGQALIFLSTVTPNDQLALASFSRGSKLLRLVLEQDPEKETLKLQLESLGADEEEEEEEVPEDEDGNAFDLDAEIDRDDAYSDDENQEDGYGQDLDGESGASAGGSDEEEWDDE